MQKILSIVDFSLVLYVDPCNGLPWEVHVVATIHVVHNISICHWVLSIQDWHISFLLFIKLVFLSAVQNKMSFMAPFTLKIIIIENIDRIPFCS